MPIVFPTPATPSSASTGDMELIFSETLTSDSATITTGTLPTGFRDLLITATLKSDRNAAMDVGLIEFNGDGQASNYVHIRMLAERNPAVGIALSNIGPDFNLLGNIMGSTSDTVNYHTVLTLRIPRYENTTVYKNWLVFDGSNNPPTGVSPITNHLAGTWKNTAAITNIIFKLEHGGFKAGSTVAVYGLK